MIQALISRNAADGVRRRVNNDQLRPAKLVFSALAIGGFTLSVAAFLQSTTELRAIAGFAWSTLYVAAIMGLDERRRWGQILAMGILAIQPIVFAVFTAPYWQLGAVIGLFTLPLAWRLSRSKVTRLLS